MTASVIISDGKPAATFMALSTRRCDRDEGGVRKRKASGRLPWFDRPGPDDKRHVRTWASHPQCHGPPVVLKDGAAPFNAP